MCVFVFFFNDTATTEIYTLSLHDALPICDAVDQRPPGPLVRAERDVEQPQDRPEGRDLGAGGHERGDRRRGALVRSEEHTSELQSRQYLVCRLLLEKKKQHVSSVL